MFSRKELIIGIVIIVLIVIGVVVALVMRSNEAPKEGMNVYRSEQEGYPTFSIQHPEEWPVEEAPVAGGGTNTTFTIEGPSANGIVNGIVTIQGNDATEVPLGQVENVYTGGLEYQKSNATIGDISAARFTGETLGIKEVAYVFETEGTVYTVKLSYVADEAQPMLEDEFDAMVETLSFN